MAISATGLGSGLDIKSLVDQLVSAERQPVATRLAAQEARATAQLTAIGRLKGALSAFQSAAAGLADVGQFQQRLASVSDDERITASATAQAESAVYDVEVLGLATSHRLVSIQGMSSARSVMTLYLIAAALGLLAPASLAPQIAVDISRVLVLIPLVVGFFTVGSVRQST